MALVNIDKLYLSKITKDEIGAGNLVFEIPEYIPGIQQFDAKPKVNTAKNYEEGVLVEQNSSLEGIDISFELGHLSNAQYAKYLGHNIAAEGGVYALEEDEAPYIALLVEYTKSNGKKGYKVYYKGKIEEPDDSIKQKQGKIDYQGHKAKATFQPLVNNGMWKYTVEDDDDNCPENIATTFFQSVIVPGLDLTIPTVTASPVDGATSVSNNSNITFTFSKEVQLNTVTSENVFLIKVDGTPVAADISVDSTSKIITLDPTATLDAGSYVAICTKGIKTITGASAASNTIVNFTV